MTVNPSQGGVLEPKAATNRFARGYELASGYSTICQGLHRDMTCRARTSLALAGGGECGPPSRANGRLPGEEDVFTAGA